MKVSESRDISKLGFEAGRNLQSDMTRFVHGHMHRETTDVIPIYENFCFCLALLKQKNAEVVSEAKELIVKLLSFQAEDGNFPIYLHEYPKAHSPYNGIKVATVLKMMLDSFGVLFNEELKNALFSAYQKAISKSFEDPFWQSRKLALEGKEILDIDSLGFSPDQWIQWIITNQMIGKNTFALAVDPVVGRWIPTDSYVAQDGLEPKTYLVDCLLFAGKKCRSFDMIQAALLEPINVIPSELVSDQISYYWKGDNIHSLVGEQRIFELTTEFDPAKKDFFEVSLYTDRSNETSITIENQKGTFFDLSQTVEVHTPQRSFAIRFKKLCGEGEFTGHIFPANRKSQVRKEFVAYDWQIGLRTLKRDQNVKIQVDISPL